MNFNTLASFLIFIILLSCNSDEPDYEMATVGFAKTMSVSDLRSSVKVEGPRNIETVGKIYSYSDYIFINDSFNGVHVIDNSDPTAPTALLYINIPGNEDISIKNNFLYADSAIDLLVFDISNINAIVLVERLENVFSIYDYRIPAEAEFLDFSTFDHQNEIIVGWDLKQERRELYEVDEVFLADSNGSFKGGTGQGGSLARFQIVEDYLYAVGRNELSVFNIENLSQPSLVNTEYIGWNIETMFYAKEYIYLGSSNGMFIYDTVNPAAPSFVSDFTHWEGCDPVVVDGDFAYLTLRGGNECGQDESVLEVIDIKDKTNPILINRYILENPYGLGFKDNALFVCDGTAGLKIFDKSEPQNLQLIKLFPNVSAKDVIPLDNILLMIGENALYQYQYSNQELDLLSTYYLN